MRMPGRNAFLVVAVVTLAAVWAYFSFTKSNGSGAGRQESGLENKPAQDTPATSTQKVARTARRLLVTKKSGDDPVTKAIVAILDSEGMLEDQEVTETLRSILAQLTEDERKVVKLNVFLNRGEKKKALEVARDIMDSDSPDIRKIAARALGWLGSDALVELSEMLADPDPSVVQEALENWEMAFDEIATDELTSDMLLELLPTLTKRELVDKALMSVTRMSRQNGLKAVSEIIEANKGNALVQDASRVMWTHLTGGESEYAGPESVDEYIQRKAEEQEEAMLFWRKVAAALEAGDEALARELLGLSPETESSAGQTSGGGAADQ